MKRLNIAILILFIVLVLFSSGCSEKAIEQVEEQQEKVIVAAELVEVLADWSADSGYTDFEVTAKLEDGSEVSVTVFPEDEKAFGILIMQFQADKSNEVHTFNVYFNESTGDWTFTE